MAGERKHTSSLDGASGRWYADVPVHWMVQVVGGTLTYEFT